MVSSNRTLATSYGLSIVTMSLSAAIHPQFLMERLELYVAVS